MTTSDTAHETAERRRSWLRAQGKARSEEFVLQLAVALEQYVRSHEAELRGEKLGDFNELFMPKDQYNMPTLEHVAIGCRAIGISIRDLL